MGFHLVPQNFMKPGGKGAYVHTGEWAKRAIKEGKLASEAVVVAHSEDKNFNYIPKGFSIPSDADYSTSPATTPSQGRNTSSSQRARCR